MLFRSRQSLRRITLGAGGLKYIGMGLHIISHHHLTIMVFYAGVLVWPLDIEAGLCLLFDQGGVCHI